jgi:hypothetical protein
MKIKRIATAAVGIGLPLAAWVYFDDPKLARDRQMAICIGEAKEAIPGVELDGWGPEWRRLKDHTELCMLRAGYTHDIFRASCALSSHLILSFQSDCYLGNSLRDRFEHWSDSYLVDWCLKPGPMGEQCSLWY